MAIQVTASNNATTKVTQLYVAMFGRAPDMEGLNFWGGALDAGQSVAQVAQAMFGTTPARAYFPAGSSSEQVIQAFYVNVLGRQPDAEGLAFWVARLDALKGTGNTNAEGQVITEIISIVDNYQGNTPEGAASAQLFANKIEVANFWVAENGGIDNATKAIALVNSDPASVNQVKAQILNGFGELVANHIFTLTENVHKLADVVTNVAPIVKNVTYVGFNPHANGETGVDNIDGNNPDGNDNNLTNENVADGGVPLYDLDQYGNPVTYIYTYNSTGQVTDVMAKFQGDGSVVVQKGLFSYLKDITGLDFVQMGLINVANGDDNGLDNGMAGTEGSSAQQTYPNLSTFNITANNTDASTGTVNATISFEYGDGHIHQAEVDISEKYFKLLTNMVFDEESNLRLYEKQVTIYPKVTLKDANGADVLDAYGNPVMVDLTQLVDEGEFVTLPIVLTPSVNNGGTEETGLTSNGLADTIKVGRLDLLHGAYIDGGTGADNTLEIYAKGYFAQPKELINIQHISIENLPNIYTVANPDGEMGGGNTGDNPIQGQDGYYNGYPDLNEAGPGAYTASVIDLSTAGQIKTLTITEGDFVGLVSGTENFPGVLTVTGIRNGAEVTLDGAFSKDVKLNFSDLQGKGVNLVLNNVNFGVQGDIDGAQLIVAHNSNTLNIESTGGGNFIANADLVDGNAGGLTTLNISGDAHLYIEGDLDASFHDETPVAINASANTAGVNLTLSGSQNVTFVGSQGNDIFKVQTLEDEFFEGYNEGWNNSSVTIQGGEGNNLYVVGEVAYKVDITNGNGNNDYEVDEAVIVNIQSGNGNNRFQIDDVQSAHLVAGNGNNKFEVDASYVFEDTAYPDESLDVPVEVNITAGNGINDIDVVADTDIGTVKVTVGNGGNAINIEAATINVTAGTGADDIRVEGRDITVDAGGSGNTITVVGNDDDYTNNVAGNTDNAGAPYATDAGALININAGTNSTVILGSGSDPQDDAGDGFPGTGDLTAKEGSSITGTNVRLVVDTIADLRAANLSGITSVVLDDDASAYAASGTANAVIDPQTGLPTVATSRAVLTLTSSQFKDLGADAFRVDGAVFNTHAYVRIIVDESTSLTDLGVDGLPRNIDLLLEVQDGVTLTMTAEQLHTKVAPQGVTLAHDGNTDLVAGKVVITNGGDDFDPFNTSDTVKTNIGGNKYYGGSLSSDFSVDGKWYNVTVSGGYGGYNRPADAPVEVVWTIDGDQFPTVGAHTTWNYNIEIIGSDDVVFTGAGNYGVEKGANAKPFVIDFSQLEGQAVGLTLGNFENVGAVYGNSGNGYTSVVNVELDDAADKIVGTFGEDDAPNVGLVSSGVTKYVVTKIGGPTAPGSTGSTATIVLCDTTQDLEVLALQGNWNDTLQVIDAAWGLVFELQGGTTAKADGPTGTANVGKLLANYQWDGADAVVNLVHSVAGDTRDIRAFGITVNNADSITVNTGAANAVIDSIAGTSLDDLILVSEGNVAITAAMPLAGLDSIDASAVEGNLSLALTGTAEGAGFEFTAAAGTTTLALNGVAAGTHSSFSAEDAATFNIVVNGSTNLSAATLENVDAISLGKIGDTSTANSVTLSAEQALEIGLANIQLTHPGLQGAVNLTNLGNQAFNAADLGAGVTLGTVSIAAGNVILDPTTVLTGATVTVAKGSTLELTADQFMALKDLDGVAADAVIKITGLTQAHIDDGFTLAGVSNAKGIITLAEDVNLADATSLNGFSVILAEGQTLGLATEDQANGLVVEGADNTTVTLLFSALDALQSINVAGYNVDVLRFPDLLVNGQNVDAIFDGLLARVEKVIYNNAVSLIDQTVTISAGTFVRGNLSFDRTENDLELENFVLNLQGGTVVQGGIDLGVAAKDGELIQTYLKTVTINSTGTAANPQTGKTDNIITGSLTAGTGITENELLDVTVNAAQNLVIQDGVVFTAVVNSNEVATLTVTGTANVSIADLNTQDDDVDGLNVVNEGAGTLTVGINAGNIDPTDALSFTGTGDIVLTVTGAVDLSDDSLAAVTKLVLADGANVTLTMAQADAIGAGDIVLAQGAAGAALNLEGLDGQPFAVANYGAGVTVNLMTLAADPVITLNAATNLTGINGLIVPEGTVLNMTAAQFQQLGNGNGVSGIITGVKADGTTATSNYTVNITDLTQADVAQGFDLSDITSTNITVTLAESVSLSTPSTQPANWDGINLLGVGANNGADINIGGFQLTLESVALANGLNITGTAGSVLKFTDMVASAADLINAAGFNVSELHMTAQLVAGQNVDLLFEGLAASVTKVITDDYGYVTGTTQTVVIEGGSTITTPIAPFNHIAFIKQEGGVEILDFTMNLEGGVNLTGNVNLSKDAPGALVPRHLQTVTINSTGTTANVLNGATANVITGSISAAALTDVDPLTTGNQATKENNLLNVTINAEQALVVLGGVVFNSVTADGTVTANDNDSAVATLTVNGTANVTLGSVDLADTDVDGLNVVNNGTGTLALTLDTADSGEALSFTGTGDIALTIDGSVNLSDDVLTAVSEIKVIEGGTLTLSYGQLQSVGAANVTVIDGTDGGTAIGNAALTINGYAGGAFDATALDAHFATVNLVLVNADVTLGAGVNLTNVDSIVVQEGHTLTLTAAQFQQLQNAGVIVGADTDGDSVQEAFNIVITGLTQADVDAGFDLSGVNTSGGTITISLGEPSVDLGTFNTSGALVPGSAAVLNGAQFVLAAGQTLGLVNFAQANGLDVNGGANTTIVYKFADLETVASPNPLNWVQIDASGYNVTVLKALAASFSGVPDSNVEFSIDDLPSSVTLSLYADPADLGFLAPTLRNVVIEAGVTTPVGLIFNDWDTTDEVRTLSLTLEGNSTLNGDLAIPTRTNKDGSLVQRFFDTLTINSTGTAANTINGNITTVPVPNIAPTTSENNLLKVAIAAQQNLVITGDIVFNSIDDVENDVVAALTVSGTANVTVQQLNVADADIGTLNIANTGTGTFTVTGASPALFDGLESGAGTGYGGFGTATTAANLEVLNLSGTGNIVLGVNPTVTTEWGITAANLSEINASGLSGSLTIGAIRNIDSADFSFTSGTGVTKVTLTTDSLDSTNGTPGDTTDDTAGWSFDFTNAAAGSELHLANLGALTAGSKLTIEMGANGTLYIDGPGTVDLSGLVLDINQVQAIVLADGVTLQLTAAQANGLDIIAGPDTGAAGITAKVNIVDLTNDIDPDNPADAFDLSGIAQNIAGTITFKAGVNDVTLDKASDLGFFSVTLKDLIGDSSSLAGQTIRFQTEAQATRAIIVDDNGQPDLTDSSTNVVWLFNSIAAAGGIDTSGYDSALGRLVFYAALLANEGGDVEQLFTTLPSTILRVDVLTLAELNILLQSKNVDRVMEIVHFATVGDLTFSDVGIAPEEHLSSLTLHLGGQTTVGNILINDVVANPADTDLTNIDFNALTIVSHRAVKTGDLLASELYVNDNDGIVEAVGTGVENVQPANLNTVGNIGVGAGNSGVDLVRVNIDTLGVTVLNDGSAGNGAAIQIGTITYGYTPGTALSNVATLDVTGANNVTIASVIATDADLAPAVLVDVTGFTATLSAPGTSPAIQLGAHVESLTFTNSNAAAGTINLGSADVLNPNAGVVGAGLSLIDAANFDGTLNLGILALVDGTNDGLVTAFRLTSGSGITTATLGKDPDSANVPTLAAGSEWVIDYTNAASGSRFTITDDVVFGAPALPGDPLPKLTLLNVDLFITGDVDLTGVDLSGIDGNSDIFVAAGNSLTITPAQAEALAGGVVIEGDGTVYIVGDASSINPGEELSLWPHVRTVNVDLSGVTISADPLVDADNMLRVDLRDQGALNDAQVAVGFNVVGSAFADHIEASNLNDTIDGGAGNDELLGNGGSDTFLVTAGTDTILDLAGNGAAVGGDDDVLVVSAGATALATDITQFVATADTVNNGTATLSTAAAGGTINVSAAGGANGFNLMGGIGIDLLIGGAGVDVINGGGSTQVAGTRDVLTGNGGADKFEFAVSTSTAATISAAAAPVPVVGNDVEIITVPTNGAAVAPADAQVTINYQVNSTIAALVIDLAGVDLTSDELVTKAIAAALTTVTNVDAIAEDVGGTWQVTANGVNGARFDINGVVVSGADAGALDFAADHSALPGGDDVAEEATLVLSGGANAVGEVYTITAALAGGPTIISNYVSVAADVGNQANLAANIAAKFNGLAALQVTATVDGSDNLAFEDINADNGGFTLTFNSAGAVNGSGASLFDGYVNAAGLYASADIITDFGTGDTIDLNLVAGNDTNTVKAAGVSTLASALASANANFLASSGTVQYYFGWIEAGAGEVDAGVIATGDTVGLLFVDFNKDGTADGLVRLVGVDGTEFASNSIVA